SISKGTFSDPFRGLVQRDDWMRIGVDIDGTIKDTRCAAVQVYNEVLNRNVKPEEVTDFYLDKAYGLSPGEGAKLWRKWEHRIYALAVPLEEIGRASCRTRVRQ